MRAIPEQLHRTNQPDLQELFARFGDCLDLLTQMRDALGVLVTRTNQRDPLRYSFTLNPITGAGAAEKYLFSKRGYKHCRIRCPAASTGVTVDEGGLSVALTLPAGWSVLDPAEGAYLYATTTAATITLEWTDEVVQ